jgi:glycosyltransferase involved in cell wall biosynthesis
MTDLGAIIKSFSMKICMILHDPQEFGGLEEYAATLAIGLKEQGQQVSVLSTTWVPRVNQYVRRLLANGVKYVQVPKWLSRPASHWETKQGILKAILWLLSPLIFLLAVGLLFIKRASWRQAWTSAHGWLQGKMQSLITPNGYKPLSLLLLTWWRLIWRPDLLHIQGYTSGLLFAIEWAHKNKIPVVYEEHQTPDARFNWWQGFEQSINKSTRVIAVSEKSAEGLREVCGVTRPIVVRNPLLPDPLVSGWHRDGKRDHVLHVTTVARLVEAKGLEYLLETIAKVRLTHPDVKFKVFGDGPLRQDLLDRAVSLGLDGEAIFVGPFNGREELSRIMAETDIFVMSSILEGQPLGVVEAMAYGCPIVTTSVGGIPELIHDGVNGLLCPPRDPDCLAEKIRTLVEDPALRERLGRAARKSYEQGPFQPAAVSEHFISVYQDALREGVPA